MRSVSPKVVNLDGYHHQMIHTRGVRLHAVTAGEPQNPLIVLLHDSFGCWADYRRAIAPLAEHGFHVAALDLRGYGMSDKPPQGYDLRHSTGDVAGAIRTLGHEKAHVVGAGIGATIAWTLATSHPNHVESITTVGSIHPLDMRKTVTLKPWVFSNYIATHMGVRTPSFLGKFLWRNRHSFLARDLRNATHLTYQESAHFVEDLELREKAMRIESTLPAVVRTTRLGMAIPPAKWASIPVASPVMMLLDGSHQQASLLKPASKRSIRPIHSATIQGARLRPHMETPEAFASVLADFARS